MSSAPILPLRRPEPASPNAPLSCLLFLPPLTAALSNSERMYHGLSAWSSAEPEGSKSHGAPLCYVEHVNTTLQYCCNLSCCIKQLQSKSKCIRLCYDWMDDSSPRWSPAGTGAPPKPVIILPTPLLSYLSITSFLLYVTLIAFPFVSCFENPQTS